MTDAALMAVHPPKLINRRAVTTNQPHRMEGLDVRTSHGRRFRDLTEELGGEFGHASAIAVRELAGIRLTLEIATSAAIDGDAAARKDVVRLSNLAARLRRDLRAAKHAAPDKPAPLHDYLGRKPHEAIP
jgi:hypothetical protein